MRVLERTGVTVQARGAMYKAVAQSVLLYGREIWEVTGYMLKVLEGFHYRAARHITGLMAKRGAVGEWEYPLLVGEMEAAGLHLICVYIMIRKADIAEWES